MWSASFVPHMNQVSVDPTNGNGPTQGQRKTLTLLFYPGGSLLLCNRIPQGNMKPELNQTQDIYPPEGPKPKVRVTTTIKLRCCYTVQIFMQLFSQRHFYKRSRIKSFYWVLH